MALLLALFTFLSPAAYAQVTLSGAVKAKDGTPVAYASVFLKGTGSGTSTDSAGNYRFRTTEKGVQVLSAAFIGFIPFEQQITIDTADIRFDITLRPDQSTLNEVVIAAGSFEASDRKKGAVMNPIDVVTTAGNGGDIANAARTLPGAQQIGESEGLFVRGGMNDETKQFIDGTLMKNANFSPVPGIVQPARVSPFLFKGIVFSSGGYSALYGQALSGALILESVDLPDESSAIAGISPLVAVAGFQQLSKNKKSSYGLNMRYFNAALYNKVVPQVPDYFHGPEYFAADANFRLRTGETGMLKFYANIGYNQVGMRNPDIDSAELRSKFQLEGFNIYNNLSYRQQLGDDWKIDIGTTYNYSHDNIYNNLLDANNATLYLPVYPFNQKNKTIHNTSDFANGKIVLSRFFSKNQVLRFGSEYFYSKDVYNYNNITSTLTDHFFAAFAEQDIYLSPRIAARAGVRFESSALTRQSAVAPRLSMACKFKNEGQVNIAYGIFYQKPDNRFLLLDRELDFTVASHYIINYTLKARNRFFRVEAYYKVYDKLVKTDPAPGSSGEGYARGVELFFRDKKTIRNFDYWITYTFLDTKRDHLDYPGPLAPGFSTPHTLSLVAKRFFEDINLSANATYTFATGRPYYNFRAGSSGETVISDEGKTKPYHGLNVSFSYLTCFFKEAKNKDFTVIALGVNNVLGNRQVFGYNYSYDGTRKVPVTLPAPRTFFVGIFMSFGINRTEDFKNENL